MAQGKIKKGFFFYFGLFVLLIGTIFLICLVVMMFNPGKNVLWMQYFTSNGDYSPVVKFNERFKTDDGQEIGWSQVKSLKIEAGYANVTVNKGPDRNFEYDGVYVVNKSKGFTTSANAVHFDVQIGFKSNELTIKVVEPQGFLFFAKDVEVVVHSTNLNDSINFSGIGLDINTESGNIDFGGYLQNSDFIRPASINAKTSSGNISFSKYCEFADVNNMRLETSSGNITSSSTVGDTTGIRANCDMTIISGKGEVSIDEMNIGAHKANISCESGVVKINKLNASLADFISCQHGNFIFNEVNSDMNFSNSADTIISPNIRINKMNGNFTLSTSVDNQRADPDITIGSFAKGSSALANKLYIYADNGKIVASDVAGKVEIHSNDSFSAHISLTADNNNDVSIENNHGSVTLDYLGKITKTSIETNDGKITINVSAQQSFVAYMLQNQELASGVKQSPVAADKITVRIGNSIADSEKNPLAIGKNYNPETDLGQEDILINTNGNVEFNPLAVE